MSDLIEKYSVPRIGIGVIVLRNGKVLLGKRNNTHGSGEWGITGGHLEHGESMIDCCHRETFEETGIEIENVRFVGAINVLTYLPKHYVSIGFVADWKSGEPRSMEEGKEKDWGWFDIDNLPQPMFEASRRVIEAYRTGNAFFDER